MILCIAEKPSVARDIAKVLGADVPKQGYFEGNGYWVTWTFGHLCTLKEPHDYSPHLKAWNLFTLPIIPEPFGIKLIENSGVERQFKIIEKLVTDCEEVINCGDAGQEGEVIQRWVLHKAKCKKPMKRLWISSLTEVAIKEGFAKLKPAEDYNNLYQAGNARAIGDWLLGINATRLFTRKFGGNKSVLSIGRVQTPTLAMIVQRQKEIDAFSTEEYWELKTKYRDVIFSAAIDRLKTKEKAEKGLEYLKQNEFEIVSFEIKEGKEKNPRLFDLTALQVEANRKFGYSAENTLKHIQSLYEKKHTTYPRVDTTYLSESLHPQIPGILQSMNFYQELTAPLLAEPIPKSKTVFDDTKVTDHHAIIPTEIPPSSSLSRDEKLIYDLVAKRFIAVFYPECKISNTLVEGQVGTIPFKTTGRQILELGWREVYIKDKKEETEKKEKEEEQTIPEFKVGEKGPHKPLIHQGKTSPPKAYTEATLLRAMETAGKQVDDEELREMLKNNGIGRPSTRANIIETLFRRKYIERKKKNIFATSTGVELIDTIQDELLKSPELTGEWESKLRKIERGEYDASLFKDELIEMVTNLTRSVINEKAKVISFQEEVKPKEKKEPTPRKIVAIIWEETDCPKCKENKLMKGKTAIGCSNYKGCGFKVPFMVFGKKLTEKQIQDLINKGKSSKLKGFTEHPESFIEGTLHLTDDFKIELKSD
ncbi:MULTISPECIES: type IA DNA topoisomerase [unclassified Kaistella]|uniref:type IA DNA topoisomerase n=1 Tax=unclassified Kaistella TaxID=2762626 RepID=UPI0027350D1E|nr:MULTISPECIES: type IA DNA topoisomerase [unclassified Kaistella]MDP2455168.1 DNA topoisomerase 3 [Kaistella sp. SH11-4b]MDP2458142.1 DNA topoisomerase 3 [Kaistella sp. SH40-3]MDP2460935.1 DNA topoisomerase 3 [Kaistella sp. SH19-2b]